MSEGAPRSDAAAILGRIREALRLPAKPAGAAAPGHAPGSAEIQPWLPHVGPTFDDRVAAFAAQAAVLRAEFFRFPTLAAAAHYVRDLAAQEKWDRAATHDAPLPRALLAEGGVLSWNVAEGYDKQALEAAPVGVTGCEALVAQTGSVLVSSRASGGRALSVLPPHHVVIATADQLVSDLPAAFARVTAAYGKELPSLLSFVTGPSRTGDIERILVLGAHGPKRLTILLVDEAA